MLCQMQLSPAHVQRLLSQAGELDYSWLASDHTARWLQGHSKVAATFARVSGYVEQTDIHSPQVWSSMCRARCIQLPQEVTSSCDTQHRKRRRTAAIRVADITALHPSMLPSVVYDELIA